MTVTETPEAVTSTPESVTGPPWTVPHTVEQFRYWHMCWDVSKAWRLIADVEPTNVVGVEQAARAFGAPTPADMIRKPGEVPDKIYVGVGVDTDWCLGDQVDLTRPVLLVRRDLGDAGDPITVMIDGYHRLWRAWHDGIETLPCILLTEEQERKVRIR